VGADLTPDPTPDLEAPPELPLAELRRRRRELVISAAVILAISAVVFVEGRISPTLPFGNGFLFLFLNALTVFLIVLLVYLIARNLVKLAFERRRGILGSHLSFQFVLALFLVATVPTGVVLVVSYSIVSASIETWFSLQVDGALDRSREVADSYYDAWSDNALRFGEQIAEQIRQERLLREGSLEDLSEFVQAKQREYQLGAVQIFPWAQDEPVATVVNPEIPAAVFVRGDSPIVARALQGERVSVVDSTGTEAGDVIRSAVPVYSSNPERPGEVVGAVVVNHLVPHPLATKVGEIRTALEQYRAIQPYAGHIASLYQLELVLFSLVILLFALWWGVRMAKGVTGPIRALAEGTAEVARGNLDVVVETTSDDEVGFLVRSFNRMTRDLREALAGLERSNAELERRRRYMEIVLRNVDAGVVSVDAEGRVGTLNAAAERLLGIPPGATAVGRKLEELVSRPEYLEVVRELVRQTQAGVRESVRKQVQVPDADGDEVLTLVVTLTLLQDDDGRPIGAVVVFDDYTQEVKAQRMMAWREVARRIAHEIKNPLTPIQLSAQRIRRRFRARLEQPEDAKVFDECVDTISSQVETLKLLVNEFSNFARLPAADPKPGDLNRLVEEALASYAGTEAVRLEADLDPRLPIVEFDREQMRRVLTNLIDNAIAAVRQRIARDGEAGGTGRIEVRTVHDAPLETARIEVGDDGAGIRPEDRRRVFEPYFSTKDHGTGLGLAIVSRIVADHHGYVRVHANRPRGTRFIVELPLRQG
jgi:two-component system nitrogen regulation sensor histidine kinase NtrY